MQLQLPMDPLAGLRDIHLPPTPPWWPPAPGWWLLALAALAGAVLGVRLGVRAWRRGRARRAAVRTLDALRARARDGETPQVLIAELSTLMRRAAMSRHAREQVAGLTGSGWLEFLDDDTHRFTRGTGRALVSAPYARAEQVDLEALLSLCESWVRRNA
jgi:hypothetical protein